ncbi:MAG: cell division protein FtsH, partial [Solirubrobacterales bacterium]
DEIAREIDDEIRRIVEEAHQSAKDILNDRRERLEEISKILLSRETIDAKEFVLLIDGASEEEVFGADVEEEEPTTVPDRPDEVAKGAEREGPRPMPRPGFAGGAAEMRSDGSDKR